MTSRRKESASQAVFPCVLKTIAVFNKKDPIIIGVDVVEGSLRVGTPLCTVKPDSETGQKTTIPLGKVSSLEVNHKSVDAVKKGQAGGGVAVKIEGGSQPLFGRQLDEHDALYSQVSRNSIDVLKDAAFRDEVSKDEWRLVVQLKKILEIA